MEAKMNLAEINNGIETQAEANWPLSEVRIPEFEYQKERWAKVRLNKVEALAHTFTDSPNLALVFEDSKLKGDPLVLLRKQNFEFLLNVLQDLRAGQAGLQVSAEEVNIQLSLLQRLVSEKLAREEATPIQDVLKLLSLSFSKISSKLVVFSKGKKSEPRPLSDDELELLAEEEEDDDDDKGK
jgi:hypothetical protein